MLCVAAGAIRHVVLGIQKYLADGFDTHKFPICEALLAKKDGALSHVLQRVARR